eukprot:10803333-Heterocapsa_arctica.AAC.1
MRLMSFDLRAHRHVVGSSIVGCILQLVGVRCAPVLLLILQSLHAERELLLLFIVRCHRVPARQHLDHTLSSSHRRLLPPQLLHLVHLLLDDV